MKIRISLNLIAVSYCLWTFSFCNEAQTKPSIETINAINLKRGEVVVCGPGGQQFGTVGFELNASVEIKKDFNLGLSLLHSFEYDEAEKVFAKIIDDDPELCHGLLGSGHE